MLHLRITIWIAFMKLNTQSNTRIWLMQSGTSESLLTTVKNNKDFFKLYTSKTVKHSKDQICYFPQKSQKTVSISLIRSLSNVACWTLPWKKRSIWGYVPGWKLWCAWHTPVTNLFKWDSKRVWNYGGVGCNALNESVYDSDLFKLNAKCMLGKAGLKLDKI